MPRKRLLLIDDENDVREVTKLSLETKADWEVLTAGSGSDGLAIAAAELPDAILLDVMMPDMDGTTTFQTLRADQATRHIPVIFLTAKIQKVDRQRYDELGVNAVIAKPFDPSSLAAQVAEALGWEI